MPCGFTRSALTKAQRITRPWSQCEGTVTGRAVFRQSALFIHQARRPQRSSCRARTAAQQRYAAVLGHENSAFLTVSCVCTEGRYLFIFFNQLCLYTKQSRGRNIFNRPCLHTEEEIYFFSSFNRSALLVNRAEDEIFSNSSVYTVRKRLSLEFCSVYKQVALLIHRAEHRNYFHSALFIH